MIRLFFTFFFLAMAAAPALAATSGSAAAKIVSPGILQVAAKVTVKPEAKPRQWTVPYGMGDVSLAGKAEYAPNEIEICIRPTREGSAVKIAKQAILKRAGQKNKKVKIRENVDPSNDATCSKTLNIQVSSGGKTLILLPIERHFP